MAYRRFKPSIAASESEAQTVANVANVAGGVPIHAVLPTPANITNKHNLNRYVREARKLLRRHRYILHLLQLLHFRRAIRLTVRPKTTSAGLPPRKPTSHSEASALTARRR
jgi:hypothetical protein